MAKRRKKCWPPVQLRIYVAPNARVSEEVIRHNHRYIFHKALSLGGGGLEAVYRRKPTNASNG